MDGTLKYVTISSPSIKQIKTSPLLFVIFTSTASGFNSATLSAALTFSICKHNSLINMKRYSLMKDPKISAIMPIYNGGKYLNYSLSSIQNQNMKDIEIILIDDNSSDNSLTIIQEHMKKDLRIKLIKNDKNKKILYSKSIAALNSKGEYIIELDQDDMFIREDVFQILYYEAKNNSLELVQMRDFVN